MKKINCLYSVLTGILLFIFWFFYYWGNVAMMERTNLFLSGGDFFIETIRNPQGLSEYIGAFLTQLFYYRALGAFVITALSVLLLWGIMALTKKLKIADGYRFALALLTVFAAFMMLYAGVFKLKGLVVLLFFYFGALLFTALPESKPKLRLGIYTVLIPLFFSLIGAVYSIMLYLFSFLYEITFLKAYRYKGRSIFYFVWAFLLICFPIWWQKWIVYISDENLFFFLPTSFQPGMGHLYAFTYFVPLLLWVLSRISFFRKKGSFKVELLISIVSVALVGGFIYYSFSPLIKMSRYMEVQFRADEKVIAGDWDGLLEIADAEEIPSRQMLHFVALALSQKGELPDKIFSYKIVSDIFVAPPKENTYLDAAVASEFYYRMGLSNEAFHDAFQMSVSNLDFRSLQRMASLAVDRGEDALAERYLHILDKSLFYKSFVREQRTRMSNPERKIEQPVSGHLFLRSMRFISEMAHLVDLAPDNQMAKDYLMCTLLLQKNIDKFCQVFYYLHPQVTPDMHIARAYQEALLVGMEMGKDWLKEKNYPIDPKMREAFSGFNTIYGDGKKGKGYLKNALKPYRASWWYYNLLISPRKDSENERESTENTTS